MNEPMMLSRRRVLELGGLAGLGAFLAACGGGDDESGAVAGDLRYWHYFASPSEVAGLNKVVALFKKDNADISLKAEGIPQVDYVPKLVSAVQAQNLPGAVQIPVGSLPDLVEMGAAADITDRVNDWDKKDAVRQVMWDEVTRDGKIYGVPAFSFVGWLYYRSDWLKEAGVQPPKTWPEFREVAKAITNPAKKRYGFAMRGGAGGGYDLMNVIQSFGAKIVDDDGKAVLDKDKDVLGDALDFFTGLYLRDKVAPPSAPQDSFQQLMTGFSTGSTGMLSHHTGSLVQISAALKPNEQFVTTPQPSGDGGSASRYFGLHHAIANEKQADRAWEWLAHWGGNAEAQLQFMTSCGQFPTIEKAADDKRVTGNPLYNAAKQVLDTAPKTLSFVGLDAFQANHLLPSFQKVLTGQSSVSKAVDAIVDGLKKETS